MARRALSNTDSGLAARLAAFASLGAALIHFTVVPAHWHEWMPAGMFFALMATAQLIWALLILIRTTTSVLACGIALNIAAVALWVLSRSTGTPFGPHAREAELIQAADLCAVLLQIYVVMGAGWVLHRGRRAEPIPAMVHALVSLGVAGVVILAATVGVTSGLRHGHHDPSDRQAEAGHHPAPAPPMTVIKMNDTPPAPSAREIPAVAGTPPADNHGDHAHHD